MHLARVSQGPLQDVLARYIVQYLGAATAIDEHTLVRVIDPHLPPAVHDSLASAGFEQAAGIYVAPRLRGLLSATDAAHALCELSGNALDGSKVLRRVDQISRDGASPTEFLALEAACAPLTLAEPSIPVWSVPIRPQYAWELLGVGESLFTRKDSLGISVEHVYYTGATALPPAGSRVLWYVSGENTPAYVAQSVVAASGRVPWKEAFRSNRRLGIYTRDEVRKAASPSGKVGYITFGRTRPLPRAVALDRANVMASDLGTKMMLRSPWQLPAALATELMEVAFELKQ
ncbi:hypothetical protein [Demequina litorisediminis]|uniref:hypothetical protein n=1 Tax=Demequina litorisediminis TaxID=1849022 RepID=UPI0024E07A7A|nr:hypothetical protein [Demequina litorisediminis]